MAQEMSFFVFSSFRCNPVWSWHNNARHRENPTQAYTTNRHDDYVDYIARIHRTHAEVKRARKSTKGMSSLCAVGFCVCVRVFLRVRQTQVQNAFRSVDDPGWIYIALVLIQLYAFKRFDKSAVSRKTATWILNFAESSTIEIRAFDGCVVFAFVVCANFVS